MNKHLNWNFPSRLLLVSCIIFSTFVESQKSAKFSSAENQALTHSKAHQSCREKSLGEREKNAEVIFSGTVRDIYHVHGDLKMVKAHVEIKE